MWFVAEQPLSGFESAMLRSVAYQSPVSFNAMVSDDLYSYSGGLFEDTSFGVVGHAMLLVGYTGNISF